MCGGDRTGSYLLLQLLSLQKVASLTCRSVAAIQHQMQWSTTNDLHLLLLLDLLLLLLLLRHCRPL
jgi:hypothetical protein